MTSARIAPTSARRGRRWPTAIRVVLSLLIGLTTIGLGTARAFAAADITVNIVRQTTMPAASGADIVYQLSVQCTAVNDPSCEHLEATIPLPPEIEDATVGSHPYVAGSTFTRGTGLTITFADPFPAGTTLTVPITMHTQNGTTPDGFHWDVPVTVTADNAPTVTASSDGTVSASVDLALRKIVNPTTVQLDAPARYSISVCDPTNPTGLGRLFLQTGTLVDQLPDGATFDAASSGGQYDAATNTVTWSVDGFDPAYCSTYRFWVDATYDSKTFGTSAPLITTVTNHATVTATPYGETKALTASDSVTHQFTELTAPAGVFSKSSQTPFGFEAGTSHPYTYPGQWLPAGDPRSEATWNLGVGNTGPGPISARIDDRLPCSYPASGRSANVSPLAGESVCTAPTFVTEAVDILFTGNPAGEAYRSAIQGGWAPTWVSTSGARGGFELQSSDNAQARFVPTGLPGGDEVAEVVIPEDPAILFPAGGIATVAKLQGHMIDDNPVGTFADSSNGVPVVNTADFTAYDNGRSLGTTPVHSEIDVLLPHPRAELVKSIAANGHVVLSVANYGPTPLGGIVLTDLLPPGVTFTGFPNGALTLTTSSGQVTDLSAIAAAVIDDYAGSGRQLVRITLRPGYSLAPDVPGGLPGLMTVSFATHGLATGELPPGTTLNTAQLHVPGNDLAGCRTLSGSFAPPSTADPLDLDGDGATDDRFCASTASVTAPASGVLLVAQKLVKGDLDSGFAGFPTVGSAQSGGSGQFRIELTNRSQTALTNAVVYDLLPRVGDTGVRQVGTPRGSQFDALLQAAPSVSSPSAAPVVEYSTAAIPCRGEVNSQPEATWPAGCTNDWSATPPANLSTVTALRFSQLGDLPSGSSAPNVTITYPVSVPSTAGPGDVAWNSFAVTADRADTGAPMLPTEPPKVGLAVPRTDVELTKGFGLGQHSTSAAPGSVVDYRITVRHGTTITVNADGSVTYVNPAGSAPSTAHNVVVTDTLPAGLTIVPGSSTTLCGANAPGGTFDEATGVWRVGDIAPGQSYSLCFKAQVSDTATGSITNQAQVSATDGPVDIDSTPGNMGTTPQEDDEDQAVLTVLRPSIDLEKDVETAYNSNVWVDANQGTADKPVYPQGSPVRYRFTVRNTGAAPLIDVTLQDAQLAAYCPNLAQTFSLAVGQAQTVVCTRDVGYAAGDHLNVATVTGQPTDTKGTPVGPTVTDTDTAQVAVHLPLVSLVKYTNGADADTAADAVPLTIGDDVTWTYVVKNIGTEPLTSVQLSDDQEGSIPVAAANCDRSDAGAIDDPLPVGATITCTHSGTATTAGLYTNTGTVLAVGQLTGLPVRSENPSHYVTPAPQPGITLVKSTVTDHTGPSGADADQPDQAPYATPGSAVTWRYDIVNSGNTDLVVTAVNDDVQGAVDLSSCTRADGLTMADPLPPRGTAVCTLHGTAHTGLYGNVGTVTADVLDGRGHPTGATVTDDNPSHYIGAAATLAVVKSVCRYTTSAQCDPTNSSVWSQQHQLPNGVKPIWLVEVTNTGEVAVDHALVTDDVAPGCARDLGRLVPGQTVRFACASDRGLTTETTNVVSVVGTPIDAHGQPILDSSGHPTTTKRVTDDATAVPLVKRAGPASTPADRPHRPVHHPHPSAPASGSAGSTGWLPFTGAFGVAPLLTLGAMAVGLGLGVLLWGRRRT